MDLLVLTVVASSAAFGVFWLVSYVPLKSTLFGKSYSPKLFICKVLVPFDIIVTLSLILGGLLGIGVAIGLNLMVIKIFTSIGISLAVWFTNKALKPRWIEQYKQLK